MKTVFLQLTNELLTLTPARTAKEKRLFGAPVLFMLPDGLYGKPTEDLPALAKFAASCLAAARLKGRPVTFCLDGEQVVTRQYLHLNAKSEDLLAAARLEAETVVQDDIKNYLVENFEYHYADPISQKWKSVLYAVPESLLLGIKREFKKKGVKIVKISPPVTGLISAGQKAVRSSPELAEKTLAIIDIGREKSRLVFFTKGLPVYSSTFDSVYGDVLNILAAELSVTPLEADERVQKLGVGSFLTEGLPHEAVVRERLDTLMNAATSEILRTIRMVLSAERLELDEILFSGWMAGLPHFDEFCAQLALEVPTRTMEDLPLGIELTDGTDSALNSSAFLPLSGLLTSKKEPVNFLRPLETAHNNKIINRTGLAFITVIMLLVMCLQPLLYFHAVQQNFLDGLALNDAKFNEVKSLNDQQITLEAQLSELKEQNGLLPKDQSKARDALEQVLFEISPETNRMEQCAIDNTTGVVSLEFTTGSLNSYHIIRDKIVNGDFFTVLVPFEANANEETGEITATASLLINGFEPFGTASGPAPVQEAGLPDLPEEGGAGE